jgi:hypothetical protein
VKSTVIDENGDVRCPVCGARNSFTVKRTGKAKWVGGLAAGGVGALLMPKRIKCNGCGANLKREGAIYQSQTPASAVQESAVQPPATPRGAADRGGLPLVGDAAWDTLARASAALGLFEKESFGQRWLVRNDGMTIARYNDASASLSVKLKDAGARERALALEGATEARTQWYIDVPHAHYRDWRALVALAAGTGPASPAAETPPAMPQPADTQVESTVSELAQLADLHARGSLTDEEFARAKAKVLGIDA